MTDIVWTIALAPCSIRHSFAQFEREVIAKRVRDKAAQSKARGIWMGRNVPLGYDVLDRKLLANPAEASTVREGRRCPYYVSSISKDIDHGLAGTSAAPISRVPARRVEAAVREALQALLTDELQLADLLDDGDTATTRRRLAAAAELARKLGPHAIDGAHALLKRRNFSLTVQRDRVDSSIARAALLAALDHDAASTEDDDRRIALNVYTNITHRKRGACLVIAEKARAENAPDPKLVALVAKAH